MTRNDVRILDTLNQKKCLGKAQALTIKKILEIISLSDTKVRSTLRVLVAVGYVDYGLDNVNAKTYYLTAEGIKYLSEVTSKC